MAWVATAEEGSVSVQAGSIDCTIMRLRCAFIDVSTAGTVATEACYAGTLKRSCGVLASCIRVTIISI